MRTAAPRYGKKRTLREKDFIEFEEAFSSRPIDLPSGRWKTFSRADIAERDDDLNVRWLVGDPAPELQVTDPLAVLASISDRLRAALEEAEALAEELASLAGADEVDP